MSEGAGLDLFLKVDGGGAVATCGSEPALGLGPESLRVVVSVGVRAREVDPEELDVPCGGVEYGLCEDAKAGLVGAAVTDGAPPRGAEDDELSADEVVVGGFGVTGEVLGGRAGGAGVSVAAGAEGGADSSAVGS